MTALPVLGALYTSADAACTVNTGARACRVAWLTQSATPTAAARRIICLPPPGSACRDGSRWRKEPATRRKRNQCLHNDLRKTTNVTRPRFRQEEAVGSQDRKCRLR